MLTAIFSILPEWAVGILIAALLWFGVNYIWLGPAFFTAAVTAETCREHLKLYAGDYRMEMGLYTSTFGNYGNASVIAGRACAKVL